MDRLDYYNALFSSLSLQLLYGTDGHGVGTIPAFTSIRILYKVGQGVPLEDLYQSAQSKYLLTSGIYVYNRNSKLFGYPLSLNGLGLVSPPPSIAFPQPLLYTAIWTV
jgi:hypothetical protein